MENASVTPCSSPKKNIIKQRHSFLHVSISGGNSEVNLFLCQLGYLVKVRDSAPLSETVSKTMRRSEMEACSLGFIVTALLPRVLSYTNRCSVSTC